MATARKLWFTNHNVAFLAWLDFSLETDIDFNNTIVHHLKKATGQEFSDSQIRSRIDKFIREDKLQCNDSSVTGPEFKQKGSMSLRSLDKEVRNRVKSLVAKYREDFGPEFRKSLFLKPREKEKSMLSPNKTGQVEKQCNVTPSMIQPKVKVRLFNLTPGPSQAQRQLAAEDEDLRIHHTLPRSIAEKTSIEPAHTTLASPSNVPSSASSDIAIRRVHQVEVHRLKQEVNAIREQWHDEAKKLDLEDKRRKQIENDLRAEIAHLKIAREDRQRAGKNPLEELLFTKDEEIWFLKQKNHEMQKLAGFAQSIPEQRKSLPPKDISNALRAIENELQSILHGHDLGVPLLQPPLGKDADLASLVRTMFAEDPGSGLLTQQFLSSTLKWDMIVVLRALAVAALGEWVFATKFPVFCPTGIPRLLKAYRTAIYTHDGWDSLHNLELAAYSSLLDDDTFQKGIVSRKADQLASRLSKALAPLFSRSVDEQANAVFETWNQSPDVCEDRRFRFKGMFEAALKLKAATVITDERYEFVVYPPGTSIDKASPDSERPFDADDLRTNMRDPTPGQWLHASIYTYPGEPVFPTNPMADALVQSQNFLTMADKDSELKRLSSNDLKVQKSQDHSAPIFERSMEVFHAELPKPGQVSMNSLDPATDSAVSSTASKNLSIAKTPSANKMIREQPEESLMTSPEGEAHALKRTKLNHSRREREELTIECENSAAEENDSDSDDDIIPTGKASLKCSKCQRTFVNSDSRRKHEKNKICSQCEHCNVVLQTRTEFRKHQQEVHGDSPKKARAAGRASPEEDSDAEVSDASSANSEIRLLACEKCGKGFQSDRGRKLHVKNSQQAVHLVDKTLISPWTHALVVRSAKHIFQVLLNSNDIKSGACKGSPCAECKQKLPTLIALREHLAHEHSKAAEIPGSEREHNLNATQSTAEDEPQPVNGSKSPENDSALDGPQTTRSPHNVSLPLRKGSVEKLGRDSDHRKALVVSSDGWKSPDGKKPQPRSIEDDRRVPLGAQWRLFMSPTPGMQEKPNLDQSSRSFVPEINSPESTPSEIPESSNQCLRPLTLHDRRMSFEERLQR
ncbi:hypothetical protein DL98DRAFT_659315 [Cadophora sp. DSE1049]|nr:hypothetical protein DL98DRAFT_659315 [Cadophora sp. DSE1049]